VTLALGLLAAALLVPLVAARWGRGRGSFAAVVLLVAAVALAPILDLSGLDRLVARHDPLGLTATGAALLLLVAALAWCGPAADVVVRRVLDATGLPAPEVAAAAGYGAGRWIGRLERWLLVSCVAAGQPALAVVPIGGKALFRYAEVVADARATRPRLTRTDTDAGGGPTRDAIVDYVIVGSLTSWTQAIVLGLVVAAA
jgi:hypothetical protein